MITEVTYETETLAIIVHGAYQRQGVHFFTSEDYSQQLGYMQHPAGKLIEPHVHNPVPREVHYTNEVLFIRKGKLRVDLYSASREYVESRVLEAGDVILLVGGGHGFEVLEDVEMFEVKQGPHMGEADKTRFSGVKRDDIRIRE